MLKIGDSELIGKERMSFESIEMILGNNAPRIVDYVDYEGRGALKYRYASMGSGGSLSLQKLYQSGASRLQLKRILKDVFSSQLGRLYRASEVEQINLLEYYGIQPRSSSLVKSWIEPVALGDLAADEISVSEGETCPNVLKFYESGLTHVLPYATRQPRLC